VAARHVPGRLHRRHDREPGHARPDSRGHRQVSKFDHLRGVPGSRNRLAVLPALSAAQRLHGWLPEVAILQVAVVMRVTPAYLESIASFYDMLELEPVGRHAIYVCNNLSCQIRG